MFSAYLSLLGVVPPFLMLWYAERFERRIHEPHAGWRYRILVAGALASVPVLWISHAVGDVVTLAAEPAASLLDAFLVSATIEETGKLLCMYTLTRLHLAPRTRYGAFLYGLHAAAGFALVENVGMLFYTSDIQSFTVRFVLRAYMACPMHLFAGGVLGYFWSHRRFDHGAIGLVGGLGLAILIHGSYNALLLGVERLPVERSSLIAACAVGAIAVPLIGLVVLRWIAGKLRSEDARTGRHDRRGQARFESEA